MTDHGAFVVDAILIMPAVSAALLAFLPDDRTTARLNVLGTLLTLLCAIALFFVRPEPGLFLIVDDVNVVFIVLNTFVGFTTSVFSGTYIAHELETGRLTHVYLRFYHAMYQTLMFAMNLALLANNVGLMWVAVELATLTTVLMVGIYRTPEALEAAWKYFILGSVGIALALFGTILVYLAASSVLGEGLEAMAWSVLVQRAAAVRSGIAQPGVRVPAAGLRHEGRPRAAARLAARRARRRSDAHFGGAFGTASQRRAVRGAALQDGDVGQSEALAPGPLMVTLGLVSVVFAAFMLYRRHDIKRMFAYSSIEHMGIISFAFGMGGPLANFAGLLHMIMHSLDQVRDLLFRRPHRAGQGDAEDGRHSRPHRFAPGPGLGSRSRRDHDRGPAAHGHLHERIPDPDLDVRARAGARRGAGARAADCAWGRCCVI